MLGTIFVGLSCVGAIALVAFFTLNVGGMGIGWRGRVWKEYCVLKFSVVTLHIETVLYTFWERGWVGEVRGCP